MPSSPACVVDHQGSKCTAEQVAAPSSRRPLRSPVAPAAQDVGDRGPRPPRRRRPPGRRAAMRPGQAEGHGRLRSARLNGSRGRRRRARWRAGPAPSAREQRHSGRARAANRTRPTTRPPPPAPAVAPTGIPDREGSSSRCSWSAARPARCLRPPAPGRAAARKTSPSSSGGTAPGPSMRLVKRPVDLQDVDGELAQIRQRRVTGAEVVDGQTHPGALELHQAVADGGALVEQDALGDLQGERRRRHPVPVAGRPGPRRRTTLPAADGPRR